MSLTPLLNEVGQKAAQAIEARFDITQDNVRHAVVQYAVPIEYK